jgi:hypothetical protein
MTSIPISRRASELIAGDRIAAGFLPEGDPAGVVFVLNYTAHRAPWTFVAYQFPDAVVDSDNFLANAVIPLEAVADRSGLGFSREPDDPAPVSSGRVPLHVAPTLSGIAVDGHKLVTDDEHPAESSFAPNATLKDSPDPMYPEGEPTEPDGRVIGRAPADEPASETT